MRKGNFPFVCWDHESLYVIFVFKAGILDYNVDVESLALQGVEAHGDLRDVQWVKRSTLMKNKWAKNEFHKFTLYMVRALIRCKVMKHLESIFDANDYDGNVQCLMNNLQTGIIARRPPHTHSWE